MKWIRKIEYKKDGSIDYQEFYNFIQELDDMDLDDD